MGQGWKCFTPHAQKERSLSGGNYRMRKKKLTRSIRLFLFRQQGEVGETRVSLHRPPSRRLSVNGRPKPRNSDAKGQILRLCGARAAISVSDKSGSGREMRDHSILMAIYLSSILLCNTCAWVLFRRECCPTAEIWTGAASKLHHSPPGPPGR